MSDFIEIRQGRLLYIILRNRLFERILLRQFRGNWLNVCDKLAGDTLVAPAADGHQQTEQMSQPNYIQHVNPTHSTDLPLG